MTSVEVARRPFGVGSGLSLSIPTADEDIENNARFQADLISPAESPKVDDYVQNLRALFAPVGRATKKPLRTVGRVPSTMDKELSRKARKAINDSQDETIDPMIRDKIGVHHVTRGTYFIKYMDPKVCTMVNNLISSGAFEDSDDNVLARQSLTLAKRRNLEICVPEDPTLAGPELLEKILQLNVRTIAVFKPADEVRGMPNSREKSAVMGKDGVDPANEIPNEVIVSCLRDLDIRATETNLTGPFHISGEIDGTFVTKTGALLPFVPGATDFSNISKEELDEIIPRISLDAVQELAITDLSFCNADRNSGNIMYSSVTKKIHFIDNALVLPAQFQAGGVFIWMSWPKALTPFTQDALQKIRALDFEADRKKIQAVYPDYPVENLETMRITYYLLKQGAEAGLSPFELGWLMTGQPSAMMCLYQSAKGASDNDPEVAFALMTEYVDQSIGLLKEHFPGVVQKVREENVPEHLFGQRLMNEMEKQASKFSPEL